VRLSLSNPSYPCHPRSGLCLAIGRDVGGGQSGYDDGWIGGLRHFDGKAAVLLDVRGDGSGGPAQTVFAFDHEDHGQGEQDENTESEQISLHIHWIDTWELNFVCWKGWAARRGVVG